MERPPICVLLLPAPLERFILRDQAEDLLRADGVIAVDPPRMPYGAFARMPLGARRRGRRAPGAAAGAHAAPPRGRAAGGGDLPHAAVPAGPRGHGPAPGCELWYWRWDRFERAYDADRAPARAPGGAARAGGRARARRSSPRPTSSRGSRARPAGARSPCRSPPTRSPRPQGGDVVAISIGHLGWRTDWSLLRAVSERLGDRLVLLLVGEWHEEECKDDPDFAFCRAAANLVWLGRVEDEAAARLVLCADVGIVPFKVEPFNDAALPYRILKYARLGRRTVAPDLAGLRTWSQAVTVAADAEAFAQALLDYAGRAGAARRGAARVGAGADGARPGRAALAAPRTDRRRYACLAVARAVWCAHGWSRVHAPSGSVQRSSACSWPSSCCARSSTRRASASSSWPSSRSSWRRSCSGRTAAVVCAVLATVLSVVVPIINPATDVSTGAQIVGAIGRGAVFVGLALVVSSLLERQTQLRLELAASERERAELESLRAALTRARAARRSTACRSPPPTRRPTGWSRATSSSSPAARRTATLVVVGDVVGHGLAAARRASFVRATIALFAEYADDPMTILRLANTALAERDPGTEFVDRAVRELRPRPRHRHVGERRPPAAVGPRPRRAAGQRAPLPAAGDRADARGHLGRRPRWRPAAGVLLYTDGLPEARTAREVDAPRPVRRAGGARGAGRLQGAPPADIVAGLRAAAVRHAEGRPADDLCLVAVRLGAGEARSAAGRVGAEAPVARDRHEARVGHVGRRAGAGGEAVALELLARRGRTSPRRACAGARCARRRVAPAGRAASACRARAGSWGRSAGRSAGRAGPRARAGWRRGRRASP